MILSSTSVKLDTYLPTATDDLLGGSKWIVSPAVFALVPVSTNFFVAAGYKQYFSVAGQGNKEDSNYARWRLLLTYMADAQWWVTFDPQYYVDYKHSGQAELIWESEIGVMVNPGTALYIKPGSPIEPLIRGGHQEHGLRAGTYNGPAIAAFGYAAELAEEGLPEYEKHTRALRNRLRDGLLSAIPGIKINGHETNVLPNTLDVSFPGAEGEAILLHLDLLGVSASTGSACASASLDPSHVLMATGLGPELAHGSIRFSFGKYSKAEDVDYIVEKFPPVIEQLRKMSTVSYTHN